LSDTHHDESTACQIKSILIQQRRIRLAKPAFKLEVHARLVANFNHASKRLLESTLRSPDNCVLGVVGDVRPVEIGEVVILDGVIKRAASQVVQHGLVDRTRECEPSGRPRPRAILITCISGAVVRRIPISRSTSSASPASVHLDIPPHQFLIAEY